jgi:TonB family protein
MTATPALAAALRSYWGRRFSVMGVALCLHALILYAFMSALAVTPHAAPEQSILVTTIINETYPPSLARKLPTIKAQSLRPVAPVVLDTSDLRIRFPPALVPVTAPTEQVARRNGSGVVPGKPGSTNGQPGASGSPGRGPVVLDRVQPDFRSVPSYQQGTVWVRALIDKSGQVSTALVEQTSHWPLIDRAALHAVSQWRFERQSTPDWTIIGFTYVGYPKWIFNGRRLLLDIFKDAYAQQIQAAAAPSSNSEIQSPVSSRKVSRAIASLQMFNNSQYRRWGTKWATQFPLQSLLVTWGRIQSVQLLGAERAGLAFDNAAHNSSKETQWQLYAVKQQRGTFIWLVGTNAKGDIDALEGMACIATCLAGSDHPGDLEAHGDDGNRGNHDQTGPQASGSKATS